MSASLPGELPSRSDHLYSSFSLSGWNWPSRKPLFQPLPVLPKQSLELRLWALVYPFHNRCCNFYPDEHIFLPQISPILMPFRERCNRVLMVARVSQHRCQSSRRWKTRCSWKWKKVCSTYVWNQIFQTKTNDPPLFPHPSYEVEISSELPTQFVQVFIFLDRRKIYPSLFALKNKLCLDLSAKLASRNVCYRLADRAGRREKCSLLEVPFISFPSRSLSVVVHFVHQCFSISIFNLHSSLRTCREPSPAAYLSCWEEDPGLDLDQELISLILSWRNW